MRVMLLVTLTLRQLEKKSMAERLPSVSSRSLVKAQLSKWTPFADMTNIRRLNGAAAEVLLRAENWIPLKVMLFMFSIETNV